MWSLYRYNKCNNIIYTIIYTAYKNQTCYQPGHGVDNSHSATSVDFPSDEQSFPFPCGSGFVQVLSLALIPVPHLPLQGVQDSHSEKPPSTSTKKWVTHNNIKRWVCIVQRADVILSNASYLQHHIKRIKSKFKIYLLTFSPTISSDVTLYFHLSSVNVSYIIYIIDNILYIFPKYFFAESCIQVKY